MSTLLALGPGVAPTPSQYNLWSLDVQDLVFASVSQRRPFSTVSVLLEFLYVEADVFNEDSICIGNSNVVMSATMCQNTIATLNPGQWISIEPEEFTTNGFNGEMSDPNNDRFPFFLSSQLEVIDLAQFYGVAGPDVAPNVLHITLASRSRP